MSRRTITIDDGNERNLNQLRGWLLTKENLEVDYTSAVNMVMALGFNRMAEGNLTSTEIEISNNYILGKSLQAEALDDQHWNYWIDSVYPKMIKRYNELERKESHRNSVKGKKSQDIDEPA